MTIIAPPRADSAYLATTLLNLTRTPLRELREARDPDIVEAITKTLADVTLDAASSIQEQRE